MDNDRESFGLPQDLERLVNAKIQHTLYRKGSVIHAEGDIVRGACFLFNGYVRLCRVVYGNLRTVHVVLPEQVFGLASLVLNSPCPARAEAVTDCSIGILGRADFLRLLGSSTALAAWALEQLSAGLHQSWMQGSAFSDGNAEYKIAYLLLLLTQHGSETTDQRRLIKVTQADVAETVGVSRETVNRWFSEWVGTGALRVRRGGFCVLRPNLLSASPR